jgi:phage terminase large subunit-like protein
MIVQAPAPDEKPWATLGPAVVKWIQDNLVHGPGDLLGEPVRLDPEQAGFIYRLYELFPHGHHDEGRRRFDRCVMSLRKGLSKTELAALIAIAELHSEAPVRCVGWEKHGRVWLPVGSGLKDPFIAMVAYTEEQTEELAYGAALKIVRHNECKVRADFDAGQDRIVRKDGTGKLVALASSPNSTDGARTTFQHFDETHRFNISKLKKAHGTMLANIPKRKLADAWSLETTTAFTPGEASIAEASMDYAEAIIHGKVANASFFFFHRAAGQEHDITTTKGLHAAVVEATGPSALAWSNLSKIEAQFGDPTQDRSYLERVWLNRLVRSADRAFDFELWKAMTKAGMTIPKGAGVTIGFDGARHRDATAIVITEISTGFQILWGLWEQPFGPDGEGWSVPEDEVSAKIAEAFKYFKVWRLYADPPYWETTVDKWAGEFTEERVIKWATNQESRMGPAVRAYANALRDGDVSHGGDDRFSRHIGATYRRTVNVRNDKGEYEPFWVLQKERKDSPNKIDAAVAAVLSWKARLDALVVGMGKVRQARSMEVLVCG